MLTQLSPHERQLFDSSRKCIGILDRAFNPYVIQRLECVSILAPSTTIRRRGKIRVQLKETKGGALAWSIGQKIKAAREKKHLTQEALAELTGIARANIARLETGRHAPRLETLSCVAGALGLVTADLLKQPESKPDREDSDWLNAGMDDWGGALEREDRKP